MNGSVFILQYLSLIHLSVPKKAPSATHSFTAWLRPQMNSPNKSNEEYDNSSVASMDYGLMSTVSQRFPWTLIPVWFKISSCGDTFSFFWLPGSCCWWCFEEQGLINLIKISGGKIKRNTLGVNNWPLLPPKQPAVWMPMCNLCHWGKHNQMSDLISHQYLMWKM